MTLHSHQKTYCLKWNEIKYAPIRPMSEQAARKADASGRPYTVLLGNKNNPDAILEVNWGNDHVGTWFLDEEKRRYLNYTFTKIDPSTMFMDSVMLWEYSDDADPNLGDLSTASVVTSFRYQTNGIVREITRDAVQGVEDIVDRSDVPLDINWEPVPTFGEWDSIARLDREPTQQDS